MSGWVRSALLLPALILPALIFITWPGAAMAQTEPTAPLEHVHKQVEIPAELPPPRITVMLYPDNRSGYNLHIELANYRIEPPEFRDLPLSHAINGHAHLFVNGQKIRRLYGNYTHVEADLLSPGVNVIAVTLNNHDHDTWTTEGRPITSSVTIDTRRADSIIHTFSSSPLP